MVSEHRRGAKIEKNISGFHNYHPMVDLSYFEVVGILVGVPILILFFILLILPAAVQLFYPWVRKNSPGRFITSDIMINYVNWSYLIGACASKFPNSLFYKLWIPYALIYSVAIVISLYLLFFVVDMLGGSLCSLALLLIILPIDFLLRTWIGNKIYDAAMKRVNSQQI